MKAKHISSKSDQALLKEINASVRDGLDINNPNFKSLIWVKFIFYFSICVALYTMLFYIENQILFVVDYVFFGLFLVLFAFNFSHDFSHGTVFKSEKSNMFCFVTIYTLVGAHAASWKKRHIESHHFAPNVEGHDSDLKISKLIRVLPDSQWYWFHRYQHIYSWIAYMSYSLFWIFIKDFVIFFSEDSTEEKKKWSYHLTFWIQKIIYIIYLLVIPMLFTMQSYSVVIIGFLAMHFIQSLFLLLTFFMTHHVENTMYPKVNREGEISVSWLMNQIQSSNDMHPFSETANFILGGFNNHIAHHLFPNIHHIHYPKLNRILYDVLEKNNIIPNQTTYFGGIISHLKLLKKMSV